MKRIAKMMLCLILAIGLVYTPVYLPVLESTPAVATAEAASVKISKKSASLYPGTTLQLKMSGTKKKVKWSTSKKSVATVSSKGKVTAKKAGTATIKAKVGSKTYFCKVTVKSTPKLNYTKKTIYVGSTVTLKLKGSIIGTTKWSTSSKSVATVSSKGKVTAKKAGTATIKAKVGGKTLSCKVTVKQKTVNVSTVSINKTSVDLKPGATQTLTATVSPSNATNKTVAWESDNPAVATVNANGVVTAVADGETKVWATAGGKSDYCIVRVKTPVVNVSSVNIDKYSIDLTVGATQALNATVSPSNATDKNIVWSSDDPAIATVDAYGNVTAVGEGQTKVYAKAGGKSDYCTVRVKVPSVESVGLDKESVTLDVGGKAQLTATINPSNAKEQTVTWTTSSKDVATVDTNGCITAVSPGSAKITAKVGTKSAVCTVKVNTPVFEMGEVWEVPGQWRFKINSMKTHYKCNQFNDDVGEQVVTINYTYWCDGEPFYSSGLNFSFTDFKVYDVNGEIGSGYPCTHDKDSKYITEGAMCNAEATFLLPSTSNSVTIEVSEKNSDYITQKAKFNVHMGSAPSEPSTPSEPSEPSTPDEPGDTETGVTKNLTTLKNYITNYGSTNTSGNKFIKKVLTSSSGSTTGAIVYQSASDDFNFVCTNEMNSGAKTSVTMVLNRTASGTVKPEIIMLYEAANMGFQSHANFTPGSYDGGETVSFTVDSYLGLTSSSVQELSNSALQLAFMSWEAALYEKTGMQMKDIGFTEYDMENSGNGGGTETVDKTAQNLTTLKNYIANYGSTNTSGNKFIKKIMTSSTGSSTGAIVYQSASDDFNFVCTTEMNSGAKTSVTMVLNRTASGTVKPEIIMLYESADMGFQSHANFAPGSYDGEERISFTIDSSVGFTSSGVQDLSNSALQIAFIAWESALYEKTGLRLSDIGFSEFSI